MWGQANRPTLELHPLTEFGWKTSQDKVTFEDRPTSFARSLPPSLLHSQRATTQGSPITEYYVRSSKSIIDTEKRHTKSRVGQYNLSINFRSCKAQIQFVHVHVCTKIIMYWTALDDPVTILWPCRRWLYAYAVVTTPCTDRIAELKVRTRTHP